MTVSLYVYTPKSIKHIAIKDIRKNINEIFDM